MKLFFSLKTDDAIFSPEARVSFMATDLTNSQPAQFETLVFPYVRHNHGGGYNASSGVFTAPRAGTYVVLATLQGWGRRAGDYSVLVYLVQDGSWQQVVVTEADRADDWDSTSMQAVLHLAAGSRVYLQAAGNKNSFSRVTSQCSFSGALVTPDP